MFRASAYPILLSALIPLAACGPKHKGETTSSAGVSTPTVSASSTASTETAGTASPAAPVTYEGAESVFAARNYPEAAELFSRYTESNPENPWGYYMLGLSRWKSGEHEPAVAAFDRALQLDPAHHKSLFNSSRVLLEMNHPKEALNRIEKVLAGEPMSNEGLRLLGRARYQLGQVDEAIEAYHSALTVDDRDVWSMNNLGLIYIEQDRSTEALSPLARAVELSGNSPVFQNNLGFALERSGYPVAAAKAYEAAIAADSSYQKAAIALTRVTAAGQKTEADSVDLTALSQEFQGEIESWRRPEPVSDSTTDTVPATDSTPGTIEGLSDSSRAPVEQVSDTLEDCVAE